MAYATSGDCDYFVETDEPRRMDIKDAAKMLARNRQEMIANDLSRLAADEYLEDIMQHVRQMEVSVCLTTDRLCQIVLIHWLLLCIGSGDARIWQLT
jgi:hypothetical protein